MDREYRKALRQPPLLAERAAATASNAFDWLFLRGWLVQSGLTPYETLIEGDPMALRYYPAPAAPAIPLHDGRRLSVRARRHQVPLLLVPPLGITAETFDLLPQRSLARYMAVRGFHTYLVDWGRPEPRHARLDLKSYAVDMPGAAIAEVRRHSGVRAVSLMGWCMGGLFCLLHAGATRDRQIRNLITVASPIDLHHSGVLAQVSAVLNAGAQWMRRLSPLRLHQLDPAFLQTPAWMTTLSFKLTNPVGSLTTYWDLLMRLGDREVVESYATTADYLDNMLRYPAGVLRDIVVHLMTDNRLATGRIALGSSVVELSAIKANYLAYAGTGDRLVPPLVARKGLELVGSADRRFRAAPGGHMGVILGSGAASAVWEPCARWLEPRSRLAGPRRTCAAVDQTLERVRVRRIAEDVRL